MPPSNYDPFTSDNARQSDDPQSQDRQSIPNLVTTTLPPLHQYQSSPSAPQSAHRAYAPNNNSANPYSASHSRVPSQHDLTSSPAANIHFQQTTPKGTTFPGTPTDRYPDIQPDNAAASNAQSLPPSRPYMDASHSYSKSTPSGIDHRYAPFTPTGANNNAHSKLFSPKTPNSSIYSPLDLADIRPRTGSDVIGDDSYGRYGQAPAQTNSNHITPWPTYAYDWCKWPVGGGQGCGKMAIASYLEDAHNLIQVLDTQIAPPDPSSDDPNAAGIDFVTTAEATCAYPVTRLSWEPPSSQKQSTDLLATSGDHLRLWSLPNNQQPQMHSNNINRSATANTRDAPVAKLLPLALLSNSKTPEHTAPLTSLDWNTLSPKLIITSSIDTTCTIWDIPTLTAKTQLIAHDKEVFDVRFCAGSVDVFVSCGADGSVRMFDLRSLEHSTIIYEPAEKNDQDSASPKPGSTPPNNASSMVPTPPLLRLAASPHDAHLLATFASDSNIIRVLDVRQPGTALLELHGHSAALNCIDWNPHRRGMLSSGADDSLVLIWDLLTASPASNIVSPRVPPPQVHQQGATQGQVPQAEAQIRGPAASWKCDFEVSNISWAPRSPLTSGHQAGDWLGVCGGRGIWGVKI